MSPSKRELKLPGGGEPIRVVRGLGAICPGVPVNGRGFGGLPAGDWLQICTDTQDTDLEGTMIWGLGSYSRKMSEIPQKRAEGATLLGVLSHKPCLEDEPLSMGLFHKFHVITPVPSAWGYRAQKQVTPGPGISPGAVYPKLVSTALGSNESVDTAGFSSFLSSWASQGL